MTPPRSKPTSDPSNKSTRSSNTPLVPPGEFKRGTGRKDLGSSNLNPPRNPSSILKPPLGGVRGKQLADDGSSPHSSEVQPPIVGEVDRERGVAQGDKRVEPVLDTPARGKPSASSTIRPAPSLSVPPGERSGQTSSLAAWPVQPRYPTTRTSSVGQDEEV
jgi:hypothetical protein